MTKTSLVLTGLVDTCGIPDMGLVSYIATLLYHAAIEVVNTAIGQQLQGMLHCNTHSLASRQTATYSPLRVVHIDVYMFMWNASHLSLPYVHVATYMYIRGMCAK